MNFPENLFNKSDSLIFQILFIVSLIVTFLSLLLYRKKTVQHLNTLKFLTLLQKEKTTAERNQSRISDILENTSDLVSMSTIEKDIMYLNRAGKKLLEMNENTSIDSMKIKDIHPRWAYEVIQHLGIPQAIEKGTWQGETAIINSSGEEIPVSQVILSHCRPDGSIDYLSTVMRDISPQKKAELERLEKIRYFENMNQIEKVISSELDLEIMMPNVLRIISNIFSSDRAWLLSPCDPDADTLQINMMYSLPGFEQPEILNRPILITHELSETMKQLLESDAPLCFSKGTTPLSETVEKNYNVKSIMLQVLHVKTGIPWILGINQCEHDREWNKFEQKLFSKITERITDSMSVLLILRELRTSEDRFRTMMEIAPYPIVLADLTGKINFLNHSFTEVLGYTIDDIPDIETWWRKAYPDKKNREKTMSLHRSEMERTITSGKPFGPRDFETTTKYGKIKTIEFRMVLTGSLILGIMNDHSERKLAQQMLIQHEKMTTVGGLAAGMAHEINNPLGVILQGVQNTLRRVSPDFEKNKKAADIAGTTIEAVNHYIRNQNILQYLEGIQQAGTRASRIVRSMLQFSRKNQGVKTENDLNSLIDTTIEMAGSDYDMKKQYDFKKIVLNRRYQENLPPLYCIENEIEQVIFNLLKNSAQAMHEVQEKYSDFIPEMTIKTSCMDENFVITISDNGPGIKDDIRERIFEPFFTTKDVGDGTGLGLSVSYFIITNNYGGIIDVNSQAGKGTTFTITLPAGQNYDKVS